jgi:Caspase domain
MRRLWPIAALSILAMLAVSFSAAEAKTRALLVGVADYNEASGIRDLLGPRNDVTMIWRMLTARGVDAGDITVLTDGLPEAPEFPKISGAPVYSTIIGEFDRLASEAAAGDDVVFYYSGHGTREPDDDPSAEDEPEADGYDQVLLPADTGPYDPTGGKIANSLVDDELGRKLDAIRAKGTFVWVIIDSCHSGTVTRGDEVTRSVDPDLLHVPPLAERPAAASRGGDRKGTLKITAKADLVGFYAVDAFDEAIERPFPGYSLPMVGEGKKQRMGVFTYILDKALGRGSALTYADLAREISADLATDRSGGRVPQPVFDGELDHPILGTNPTGPRLVSGIVSGGDKIAIADAGILHGFDEGARLAIYSPGKRDEPIGRAEIRSAGPSSSEAKNIVWEPGVDKILDGAVEVKLTESSVNFRFAVAPPPPADLPAGAEGEMVAKAIDTAFGSGSGSNDLGIEMGEAGSADGDVLLRVAKGKLWIVRPDRPWDETEGSFGETPSIAIGSDAPVLGDQLKQSVWLLARAAKLIRLGASLGEGSGMRGLAIKAELQRAAKPADPTAACQKPDKSDPSQDLSAYSPQGVGNCDVVRFHVTNESDFTYYVGGFYVDALGGVQTLSPKDRERGCVRTLYSGTGGEVTYTIQINTWDASSAKPAAIGVENAVILAIPQDSTKIAPRLCSLVQRTLAEMQATRGAEEMAGTRGPGKALKTLLAGITGSSTRAASVGTEEDSGAKVSGTLYVFDVRP